MSQQIAFLAIQIGIILLVARLFGILFTKIKVPPVMGELMAGILLGPYCLGGIGLPLHGFENGLFPLVKGSVIPVDPKLYSMATMGSIVLLFISGLETDVRTFFRYSVVGTIVGIGGIVCSFLCGAAVGVWVLDWTFMDPRTLFLGILCTATSVGISARILSEHQFMDAPEGVTIMAAAVIDDVLGIVCLAIVAGIARVELTGGTMDWGHIGLITVKSFAIWLGASAAGLLFSRHIADMLKWFRRSVIISSLAFGMALLVAGFFEQAGLAMIIGAFVMGLSLSKTDIAFKIRAGLEPLNAFFVPLFFVVMGMLVDIRVMKDPWVLKIGLIFTLMAIIGKIVGCALPAFTMNFNGLGAFRIGIGMIPRCEVVLIIAGIAATTMMKNPALAQGMDATLPMEVPIFDSRLFGIAIIMPLITALLAPPLLKMVLSIKGKGVRHETKDKNDCVTTFSFHTEGIANFVLQEIITLLENEGFMHSSISKGIRLIHFRKEDSIFSLRVDGRTFVFNSDVSMVPLIKTTLYESVIELHQSLSELQQLTKPETLRSELYGTAKAPTAPPPDAVPPDTAASSLEKLIRPETILVNFKAATMEEAIHSMIHAMERQTPLRNPEQCALDVLDREQVASTYQGFGISLPHARTDGVGQLSVLMAISPEGVPMSDDAQQEKSHIIILSLTPKDQAEPYLHFITTIAGVLQQPDKRDILLHATTAKEAAAVFH